jgi:hypothetical protein
MHAESLYLYAFAEISGFDSARLSEAFSARLLPVCCPNGCRSSAASRLSEDRLRNDISVRWKSCLSSSQAPQSRGL